MASIKERREQLGVSRTTLAMWVGVSPRTVERWEKGAAPNPRHQRKLAKRLGVSVEELGL